MENQHQKIKGYRDLSQEEIDLMNEIKAATPERFAAMAKTDFQTGLMYLVRSVAQPTSF